MDNPYAPDQDNACEGIRVYALEQLNNPQLNRFSLEERFFYFWIAAKQGGREYGVK
jgi:hypothetical protein